MRRPEYGISLFLERALLGVGLVNAFDVFLFTLV